jgi:hypothetical protein
MSSEGARLRSASPSHSRRTVATTLMPRDASLIAVFVSRQLWTERVLCARHPPPPHTYRQAGRSRRRCP